MKKTILIHDASGNSSKSINKYLIEYFGQDSDYDVLFNVFHQRLYHMQQTKQPDVVVWSLSEYTQEIHDYIVEYSSTVKIILLVDNPISQPDLIEFLNNSKVNIILDKRTNYVFNNTIAEYGMLYEDALFFDQKKNRNNKTLVLLSQDNNKNLKIINLPKKIDKVYNIVTIGNNAYDSDTNLGLFRYAELGNILANFSRVVDIDNLYRLECQACSIPCSDIKEDFDITNITSFQSEIDNIEQYTYKNFVNTNIIPFIRK